MQEAFEESVEVSNPKALKVGHLPAQRVPLGRAYKPCIARLRDGELVMVAYGKRVIGGGLHQDVLLWRSRDGGRTWTERRIIEPIGKEAYLSALKDGTIFMRTGLAARDARNSDGYSLSFLYRSPDGGHTWQTTRIGAEDVPGAGGKPDFITTGYGVLELGDGTLIFGVMAPGGNEYLWRSGDRGKTWDKTLKCTYHGIDQSSLPYGTVLGEAVFRQAPCGDILAPARILGSMYPLPGTVVPEEHSDHYERMVLYRSKDGGANWTIEELGSYYGEMYPSFLRLQDGRLLFTFTVRAAVPPRLPPLGVRAVLGRETHDGFEFDFEHDRIMLDTKTPIGRDSGGGFGPTVQLDDGTLVTSYSYAGPGPRGDDKHVEVVRWRLP